MEYSINEIILNIIHSDDVFIQFSFYIQQLAQKNENKSEGVDKSLIRRTRKLSPTLKQISLGSRMRNSIPMVTLKRDAPSRSKELKKLKVHSELLHHLSVSLFRIPF